MEQASALADAAYSPCHERFRMDSRLAQPVARSALGRVAAADRRRHVGVDQ